MKVIRSGGPWERQYECKNQSCRSILLVGEADVVVSWVNDPRPTQETHSFFFTCPVCKTRCHLDSVPAHVADRAIKTDREKGIDLSHPDQGK